MGIYYSAGAMVGIPLVFSDVFETYGVVTAIRAPFTLDRAKLYGDDTQDTALQEGAISVNGVAVQVYAAGYDQPATECPLAVGVNIGVGAGSKAGGDGEGYDPAQVAAHVETVRSAVKGTPLEGRPIRLLVGTFVS